jgi:hypothetical protein
MGPRKEEDVAYSRYARLSPQVRIDVAELEDAQYRFSVTARDEAGNAASPVVFEWVVDTAAPETVPSPAPSSLRRSLECPRTSLWH